MRHCEHRYRVIFMRYIIIMQPFYFPTENYYHIICKHGDQALRIQENDPTEYERSRILGCVPNKSDNGQLFMVTMLGQKNEVCEIINCVSDLVFDEESNNLIRLKRGKQSKEQKFKLVKAPVESQQSYYWIKTAHNEEKALNLEGVLRCSSLDLNKDSFLFRFKNIENETTGKTAILVNKKSGMAIDIPEATEKKGQKLIQWFKHRRWNQRWQFEKGDAGFYIKNIMNGLVIDIQGESKSDGAKIIQWQQTGNTNQQWHIEKKANETYRFRSCHENSLFLAVKKQSTKEGERLEVCSDDNPSMDWKIEGFEP